MHGAGVVTVRMIVGSNEISIGSASGKVHHLCKSPRAIEVVIFCKHDEFCFLLPQQEVNLTPPCLQVPYSWSLHNFQFIRRKDTAKEIDILGGTSIQHRPDFEPESSKSTAK